MYLLARKMKCYVSRISYEQTQAKPQAKPFNFYCHESQTNIIYVKLPDAMFASC